MKTAGEIHEMLAQAHYFYLRGDPMGAMRRARDAVAASTDDDLRDEAELAVERYEAAAREWRDEIERRWGEHRVHELREQGLPAPPIELVRDRPPRRWSWLERRVSNVPRVVSVPR